MNNIYKMIENYLYKKQLNFFILFYFIDFHNYKKFIK